MLSRLGGIALSTASIAEMPKATDFEFHIFAALAQEERRLISIRTKAALQQSKRQAKALGVNGKALPRGVRKRLRSSLSRYGSSV